MSETEFKVRWTSTPVDPTSWVDVTDCIARVEPMPGDTGHIATFDNSEATGERIVFRFDGSASSDQVVVVRLRGDVMEFVTALHLARESAEALGVALKRRRRSRLRTSYRHRVVARRRRKR